MPGRTEKAEPGTTRTATATQDCAGGQARPTDTYIVCYCCIISSLVLNSSAHSSFLVACFSTECNNRQDGMGRDQHLRLKQRGTGKQRVRFLFFVLLLLSSLSPLFFLIISFSMK